MAGEINFGAIDPNAVMRGAAQTNDLLQSWAKVRAGKKLAEGDRTGAVATLNKAGDLSGARQLETQDWENQDRVKALSDAQKKESAQFINDVSGELGNILVSQGKDAVLPAFDQLVPVFKHRGASDEEIASYRESLAQDPERFLTALNTQSKAALDRYSFLNVGTSVVRGDKQTGQAAEVYQGDQYKEVSPNVDLVRVPGAGTTEAGLPKGEQVAQLVTSAFPGAQVTSMGRTPDHNKEVGGVPTSMHLTDHAIDFVPPPGLTLEQAKAQLVAQGVPVTEALNEGDHFHFGWAPKGGGAAEVIHHAEAAPPKEAWRAATPQEAQARGYVGGQINTVTGEFKGTDTVAAAAEKAAQTNKASGTGPIKLSPQDSIYVSKARDAAQTANNMSNLMDQFIAGNKGVDTGGLYAAPGVAQVVAATNKRIGRLVSITSQLTPAMRNGLPGAASDRDVAMFRSATVGVDKPYQTNLAIAKAGKAFAARQNDYVAFIEAYAKANGSLLGAQEIWNTYTNSYPLYSGQTKDGIPVINTKLKPWRSVIDLRPANQSSPNSTSGGKKFMYNPTTGQLEPQ